MLGVYVEDAGISSKRKQDVDEMVERSRKQGFEMTREEGSFSEFLGIKLENMLDGAINMTQKGLIQKIIEAVGMTNCNSNRTSASSNPLGSNPNGEPISLECFCS